MLPLHQIFTGFGILPALPDSEVPAYRVAGGTSTLIEILMQQIGPEQILLQTAIKKVKKISPFENEVAVSKMHLAFTGSR